MTKKHKILSIVSMSLLTAPNLAYLSFNFNVLREANVVALSMTSMLILSIVGMGALTHIKANAGVWACLIGIFILALSNVAYIAGTALLIEGGGLAIDGYVIKPEIIKEKTKEIEANGGTVTYTREIK